MKKVIIFAVFIFVFLPVAVTYSNARYGKPEFRGRIIDAETKEPIDGAVAVVLYDKQPLNGGPGGANSYVFHAKETLTDSKGEFYFPSLASKKLFTEDIGINFIFYKPGYMATHAPAGIDASLIHKYFATVVVGKVAEIHNDRGRPASYKGPLGIVELKRVLPEKAMSPGNISDSFGPKELPLYYKALEEDRKSRERRPIIHKAIKLEREKLRMDNSVEKKQFYNQEIVTGSD